MNNILYNPLLKRLLIPFLLPCCLLISVHTKGQEKPPRPILVRVSTAQHLQFGSFIQSGSSGTVTVSSANVRSATGTVILPNINSIVSPALFIVDAEPGTLITILNGPATVISNGGFNMTLEVGEASTRSPFITRTQETYVYVGGTLHVGPLSANPAGSYSGTFTVTFIQE